MKTKLLLPALLLTAAAFAQNPVPAFYNFNTTPGGVEADVYSIVDTSTDLGEAASTGENVVWNFSTLTESTTSSTQVITPTAEDIATYPGSTLLVRTTTGNGNVTRYFFAQDLAGGIALTGAETTGFTLNYSTNNAFIGNFPVNYGYTNTDANVAGTFQYGTYNGTFAGTGTTTADAYGTLTVNVGSANNTPVTRIKNVQDLVLTAFGIQAGTATQTIYSYYGENLLTGPIFRSITTHLIVPLAGLDTVSTVYESYEATALNAPQVAKTSITLAPNPVSNVLHFAGAENISKVTVIDATGRTVLKGNGNNVSAESLSAGIYYATAQTETGSQTVKFIKK